MKHGMFDPATLAVLAAAIDGHNPKMKHGTTNNPACPGETIGTTYLDTDAGPSDLELAIDEFLWEYISPDHRRQRHSAGEAVTMLAQASRVLMYITAMHCGRNMHEVDTAAIGGSIRLTVNRWRASDLLDELNNPGQEDHRGDD